MTFFKGLGIIIFGSLGLAAIIQRNAPGGENNIYLGYVCLFIVALIFLSLFHKKRQKQQQPTAYRDDASPHVEPNSISAQNIDNSTYQENLYGFESKHVENIRKLTLFLKWCKNHTSILPKEQYPSYMHYSWDIEEPVQFHTQLIEQGYLIEMTLEQKIFHLKVADLKNILKSHNLPVSGKKQELIQRVLEHVDLNSITNIIGNQKEYSLSEKAINFLAVSDDICSLQIARQDIQCFLSDGVEKYQILAILDSKTCGICGDLDGKIFQTNDAIIGLNFPPFHQGCRCTTVPYYDDMDLSDITRTARDADGNYISVPGDMTYKEWKEQYSRCR